MIRLHSAAIQREHRQGDRDQTRWRGHDMEGDALRVDLGLEGLAELNHEVVGD